MTAQSHLQFGANHRIQILVLQPLFEEANRLRRIIVQLMRALDGMGIGTFLPDLPGCGESPSDIAGIRLSDWRTAVAAAHAPGKLVASFRAAALFDDAATASAHWRFAPESGQRLVRDLRRTQLVTDNQPIADGLELVAGHCVQAAFLNELAECVPVSLPNLRTVRLESDAGLADGKVAGTPVWRRSEPGNDPTLLAALVDDLGQWAKRCATS